LVNRGALVVAAPAAIEGERLKPQPIANPNITPTPNIAKPQSGISMPPECAVHP